VLVSSRLALKVALFLLFVVVGLAFGSRTFSKVFMFIKASPPPWIVFGCRRLSVHSTLSFQLLQKKTSPPPSGVGVAVAQSSTLIKVFFLLCRLMFHAIWSILTMSPLGLFLLLPFGLRLMGHPINAQLTVVVPQ
jgi:hypothetical protein